MGLTLSEDQLILKQTARSFLEEKSPVQRMRELRDAEDATGFSPALWKEMAEMGDAQVRQALEAALRERDGLRQEAKAAREGREAAESAATAAARELAAAKREAAAARGGDPSPPDIHSLSAAEQAQLLLEALSAEEHA